jgi:hypothetical protein
MKIICTVLIAMLATSCAPAGGLVVHNEGGVIFVIGSNIEKQGPNTGGTVETTPTVTVPLAP